MLFPVMPKQELLQNKVIQSKECIPRTVDKTENWHMSQHRDRDSPFQFQMS